MSDFQAILQNALNGGNVEDNGMDTTVNNLAHWQRICAAGIAAVSAASTTWLQLSAASVVLNFKDIGLSASDKALVRRSMLKHLFQSEHSCSGLLRMSPNTFNMLCEKLKGTGRLSSYAHTSADEQVATFLFIIGQKFSNRAISFFMSRSGETCSRYFHNVLHALISLASELVKQPTENDLSNVIRRSTRFYPYFKDCLGALDGTHVRVKGPYVTTYSPNAPSMNQEGSGSPSIANMQAEQAMPSASIDQTSSSSGKSKGKRKASEYLELQGLQANLNSNISDLSRAIVESAVILATKSPRPPPNCTELFNAVHALDLEVEYMLECYEYLVSNEAKTDMFLGTAPQFRGAILARIMNSR